MKEIIGYKGFNNDLTCQNNFQYEIGKTYEMDDKPKICKIGYHFCNELRYVFDYYPSNCRICKVKILGDIDYDINNTVKYCTNKIEILEEIYVSKEDRIKYVYANQYLFNNDELDKLLSSEFILDKYINDEDYDVRSAVAKQGYGLNILINDEDYDVRSAVAEQGYGLDKLVNDLNWHVRLAVAEQGYGLNKLVNDEDCIVRKAVAKQGYGLNILINDDSYRVRRAVADQGYGLDKLINDEDWGVRETVAKQGYGLDKLINDASWRVREAAERQLKLLNK